MAKSDRPPKSKAVFDEPLATTGHPVERPVHPNIHESLIQAIKSKNFVTLLMRDHTEESGEPHIYGTRGGQPMLLLFNEENEPQWELVEAAEIESVKIWLDEHFQKREIPPEFDPDRRRH